MSIELYIYLSLLHSSEMPLVLWSHIEMLTDGLTGGICPRDTLTWNTSSGEERRDQ